jgi:polyhydroxybutyrate depolymerase
MGGTQRNRVRLNLHRGRLRLRPPEYFERSEIEVGGIIRSYWMPPAAAADQAGSRSAGEGCGGPPPLLVALHGLNSSGSRLAWWSGLDRRGPLAGFHCVFPDALETIWDDHGCGRRDGADDPAFIAALIRHLGETGVADPGRVVVTGVSSGATFAEHLVRSAAVDVAGLALVVGTTRAASHRRTRIGNPDTDMLLIAGTGDPIVPYEGGLSRGPLGRRSLKQVKAMLLDPSGHEAIAPEALTSEWAAASGCLQTPATEGLPPTEEGFSVDRAQWLPGVPSGPGVTLYRIAGGGHGWPSAKQYLPRRYLGRIPQGFDATGTVLGFARVAVSRRSGSRPTTLVPTGEG